MWIFSVGNDLDKHKTGSVVPTLSKPCLQLLDFCQTYQLALKLKNCGRSDLCSPVTPSISHAANTTVLATTQILFTDLQLLRHSWKLGLHSLHLSGWFKNIYSQNHEHWIMGTYRTQWVVRTKLLSLCVLIDLVTLLSWSALMKYFEASVVIHSTTVQWHLANICLNTKHGFSTQHWTYMLPAELFGLMTPGEMGNIHKKKHLTKTKLSNSVMSQTIYKDLCLAVCMYVCLMRDIYNC